MLVDLDLNSLSNIKKFLVIKNNLISIWKRKQEIGMEDMDETRYSLFYIYVENIISSTTIFKKSTWWKHPKEDVYKII